MMKTGKQRRKPNWKALGGLAIATVLGLILGGLLGRLTARVTPDGLGPGMSLLVFGLLFLALVAVFFLQILIHEGGHLVFGLLSGYRFCSFRVGSLMLLRQGDRLHLKRMSLAGTGGQCLMEPPEPVDGRIPHVLYNLGGSLMNLMASALFLGLFFLFRQSPVPAFLLLSGAAVGLFFALLNGIPLRLGALDNDGCNARSLGRDPEALHALWVQLKINALVTQGVRLRDMPREWFPDPGQVRMDNAMTAALAVFTCNRLMDAHEFQAARQAMEGLVSGENALVGLYHNLLLNDILYCELLFENRKDRVDRLLSRGQQKFMKSMKNFPSILRTQYALALLSRQDETRAAAFRRAFEKVGASYPYPSEWESERELLDLAQAKADALRQGCVPPLN